MCKHFWVVLRSSVGWNLSAVIASASFALWLTAAGSALADPSDSKPAIQSAAPATQRSTNAPLSKIEPAPRLKSATPIAPLDDSAYFPNHWRGQLQHAAYQPSSGYAADERTLQANLAENPCAAMDEKPLTTLGIGIALPEGKLPEDYASACWDRLNQQTGPYAALRFWPTLVYSWDATCLCHRPLYFEEINLERHGYGCCCCWQPLASAAHFFGTIPALPYCMAVECPGECVYTLGHYRPGSCPPWRHHWPPCSPLAAAAEGGVWTGLIFLIP